MSMSMTRQESKFGIRWVPTILGALVVIWALTWIVAGALGSVGRVGMLGTGIVLLAVGIALLRFGRRDLTRPVRSSDQRSSSSHGTA
jgi:Na+/melibiose symporter-like transporter